MNFKTVKFSNGRGQMLDGRLEFPITGKPLAYAIFAHAFTGNKNLKASRYICRSLTLNGIAVLRFDFTGLGDSEGDFADTNFSTNVMDIEAAAEFLSTEYNAPKIIVGHSLGGAASVFAAKKIESVKAVATVGTPSEPEHVTHLLEAKIEDIEKYGEAEVKIGTKTLRIKKQFVEDLASLSMKDIVKDLNKAILILHSPQDEIVEIENAAKIYHSAHHPKSFITLNNADHMLLDKEDANYVGDVIASWVERYIDIPEKKKIKSHLSVVAKTGEHNLTTDVVAGRHGFLVDQSEKMGGMDFGPSPYELLSSALASSTSMTIYKFGQEASITIEEVKVHISFDSKYEDDMAVVFDDYLDKMTREIELSGDFSESEKQSLLKAADKCPIYLSLTNNIKIETKLL